jgi:hypothetical protein
MGNRAVFWLVCAEGCLYLCNHKRLMTGGLAPGLHVAMRVCGGGDDGEMGSAGLKCNVPTTQQRAQEKISARSLWIVGRVSQIIREQKSRSREAGASTAQALARAGYIYGNGDGHLLTHSAKTLRWQRVDEGRCI